jgi:hypothetical protein
MALRKRKMALFKRKSGIEPEEIVKALWHLPTTGAIQSPTSASSSDERNVGSLGQAAPAPTDDRNYLDKGSRVSGKFNFQSLRGSTVGSKVKSPARTQ